MLDDAANTLEVSDGNDEDILVEVINLQGEFLISIEEQVGEDEWNALSSVNVNSPQNYHLTFIGTGRPTRIRVVNKTAEEELGRIVLRNIRRWRLVYEPENVLVQVCNTAKDRYRFGFNTQEKLNEIAGIGNHTTAMFGEFDTRLGRRWNPDPKASLMPNESPYAVNHDNPILNTDPKGDFGVVGALIGGAIGGVASLTKSVIQEGWESLKDGKTWAKAGVNAVGGAVVGATGGLGAGLVATATTSFGASLAEDAIDGKDLCRRPPKLF